MFHLNLKKKLLKNIKTQSKKTFIFNPSEKNKSQKSVDEIHNILFKNRFNRDDCIIAYGGGITGDVVGYSASIYKRGMKFIYKFHASLVDAGTCLLYTSDAADE